MNCKHCGKPIYCVDGLWFPEGSANIWCGNIKHEPASPVAQPELCRVCAHPKHEGRCKETLTHAIDTLCPCVMAVAQSGAGGDKSPFDMFKLDRIRMRAEEGHDINHNDVLYLIHGISKLLNPSTRPSSPSGQAAATTPQCRKCGCCKGDTCGHKQYCKFGEFCDFAASPTGGAEPPQHHCFRCGSIDPLVKLSVHAHMIGNRIPGWQNVSDVCIDSYHAAAPAEPSAEHFHKTYKFITYSSNPKDWYVEFAEAYAAHVTSGLRERIVKMQQTIDLLDKLMGDDKREAAGLREQLEQANKARNDAEDRRTRLARIFNDQLPSAEDSEALQHYLQHGRCSGDSPRFEKEKLRERVESAENLRDSYLETAQRIQGDFERAKAAWEAAEAQLATAREALRKYGEHKAGCKILGSGMVSHKERICTCGLDALAPAKESR